ncbi:hypothetical protein HDU67_009011 [Dinochytrium kinnereticum]|nr:hypothetical protein HDU67_009011 [Dinochytrium kinnereticum]
MSSRGAASARSPSPPPPPRTPSPPAASAAAASPVKGMKMPSLTDPRAPQITVRSSVPSSPFSLVDNELVDQLTTFIDRHKAIEVTFVWMFMSLLNFWTSFPIEWLFFLYFTLTIFVQAFELGVAVLIILLSIILMADVVVFVTVPFKFTSVASSAIVHSFLVCGIHNFGLSLDFANIRGWLFVAAMVTLRFTIWSPPLAPPAFMSPVAAHCTGFGLCYLAWKLMFLMYRRFDSLTAFFGIVSPGIPIVTVREISDTSFKIHWWVPSIPSTNSAPIPASLSPPMHPFTSSPSSSAPQPFPPPPSSNTTTQSKSSFVNAFSHSDLEVKKHLIEVNGVVIGESSRDEVCVVVTGLNPSTRYRIRVWAVSSKRLKSPSRGVLIQTLSTRLKETASSSSTSIDNRETASDGNPPESDEQGHPESESTPGRPELNGYRDIAVDHDIDSLTNELEQLNRQQHETSAQMQLVEEQFRKEDESLREELERLRESRKLNENSRAEQRIKLKQLEDSKKELDALRNRYEREVKAEKSSAQQWEDKLKAQRDEVRRVKEETRKAELALSQSADSTEKRRQDLEKEFAKQQENCKRLTAQKVDLSKQLETLRVELSRKRETAAVALAARAAEDRKRLMKAEEDALGEKILARKMRLDHEQRELLDLLQGLQDEHSLLQAELREESRAKVMILEELNRGRRDVPSSLRSGGFGSSGSSLGPSQQANSYSHLLLQQQQLQQSPLGLGLPSFLNHATVSDAPSSSSSGLGGLVSVTGSHLKSTTASASTLSTLSSAPPPGLSLDNADRGLSGISGYSSLTTVPQTSPGSFPSAFSMPRGGFGSSPSRFTDTGLPKPAAPTVTQRSYGPISSPRGNFLSLSSNSSVAGSAASLSGAATAASGSQNQTGHSGSTSAGSSAIGTPARSGTRTIESPMDLVGGSYDQLNPKGLIGGLGGLFTGNSWADN